MTIKTHYTVTNKSGDITLDIPTGRGVTGYKGVTFRKHWGRGKLSNGEYKPSPWPFYVMHGRHISGYTDPRKAAIAQALYLRSPEASEKEVASCMVENGGNGHLALMIDWKEWAHIFTEMPRFDNDPEMLKGLRAAQRESRAKTKRTGRKNKKSAVIVKPINNKLVSADRNRLKNKHGEDIFRKLAKKFGRDLVMGHMNTMEDAEFETQYKLV